MGFIESATEGAFRQTVERVERKLDYGSYNVRPEIDRKQQAEFFADSQAGRTDELYRQCLEHHGFVWMPVEKLRTLPGMVATLEGQWRSTNLKPALAFTPRDLTMGFPGMGDMKPAEQLHKYLEDYKLQLRHRKGRVPKEALKRLRDRK